MVVQARTDVVVSASIAFDHVMSFGGSFRDHILDTESEVLSVSFLVNSLTKNRGGVGGNMAYSLALLGAKTALVGAVGIDFPPYGEALGSLGVDLSHVVMIPDDFTSNAYMNADQNGNQINAFYPGAGSKSVLIDVSDVSRNATYGIVSATGPDAMVEHARQIHAAGSKLVYDPAFQLVILNAEQINEGIGLAEIVLGNEYEFEMIRNKTGRTIEQIAESTPIVVRTLAERGSEIHTAGETILIPPAKPDPFVDPTGGGDAYRSGLLKGMLLGLELPVVGRMAGLAATYAIEFHGTQEHFYTAADFVSRFDREYPDFAGSLAVESLLPQVVTDSAV
ncbi:MAG: PfkB family carbohydrate kinase [Thermomicrobiales bacterium]